MKIAKEIYMYILGALLVVGFILLLMTLVIQGIPPSNSELLYLAVGALITQVGTVVNYFFGSSKSSAEKTDLMAGK